MPPFVYSPHLSYWRSKNETRIEGGFLRYWSKGREFIEQLAGMKASTDMAPYLSLVDQKRLRISLPPIHEQRAIAHILGTLDDKIELNRRMSETLEAMARGLFDSWSVDIDSSRIKTADLIGNGILKSVTAIVRRTPSSVTKGYRLFEPVTSTTVSTRLEPQSFATKASPKQEPRSVGPETWPSHPKERSVASLVSPPARHHSFIRLRYVSGDR
jgi:Type I restriction modification DNA specificity domain